MAEPAKENPTSDTTNHVKDPEVAKRFDNRDTRRQTDLEQMQGYETQALMDAGRSLTHPQPALPDPREAEAKKAQDDAAADEAKRKQEAEKAAAEKAEAEKAAAEKAEADRRAAETKAKQ